MERSLLKKILEQYTLNDEDTEYLKTHFERFGIMLDKLEHLLKSGYHVANIGMSTFDPAANYITQKVGATYSCIIPNKDYLEYFHNSLYENINIIEFDLKNNHVPEEIIGKFDIVMLLETIEHMLYSDELILKNVASVMRKGGTLMFSVPNAVEVGKRIRTLMGKNPYWTKDKIINGVYGGYGHIREYTLDEIEPLLKPYFNINRIEKLNPYGSKWRRLLLNMLPKTWAIHIYCECIKK